MYIIVQTIDIADKEYDIKLMNKWNSSEINRPPIVNNEIITFNLEVCFEKIIACLYMNQTEVYLDVYKIKQINITFEYFFTGVILSCDDLMYLDKLVLDKARESSKFIYLRTILSEYINHCIVMKYFYYNDGIAFDISKLILFINIWNFIKLYFHRENPIYIENKYVFSKQLKDFFISINDQSNINFEKLNLTFMDFSETELSGLTIINTDLTKSNFNKANLDNITLVRLKLVNTNFDFAFMEVSGIFDCDCTCASFRGTHLLSSVIENSNCDSVDFQGTNLMECDIINTNLDNAKFSNTTAINSSIFIDSDLSHIDSSDGISIAEEQMKYFWENTRGIRDIMVYNDNFKILEEEKRQIKLYDMLVSSLDEYLIQNKIPETPIGAFISHTTLEKQDIALPIYEFLVSNGYSCWIDNFEVEEDKLRFSIETGIQNCKAAIIILSDIYKIRAWTKYELLRIIQEYKKKKINVVIVAFHLTDLKDCPLEFQKIVISDKINDKFFNRLNTLLNNAEKQA